MITLLMCFASPDCEWRLNAMFLIIVALMVLIGMITWFGRRG
jgi:hypothetical protein